MDSKRYVLIGEVPEDLSEACGPWYIAVPTESGAYYWDYAGDFKGAVLHCLTVYPSRPMRLECGRSF